ncbi:MAG: hypothetical protein ACTHKT_14335 [Solirubrobacterales bacterium]
MRKKLIIVCMAITAFAAFVIAPAASAAVLTESGVTVPKGEKVIITSTDVRFTLATSVECGITHLTSTVMSNGGVQITSEGAVGDATFEGTGSGGDCTSGAGDVKVTVTNRLCWTTLSSDIVSINGCGNNIVLDYFFTSLGLHCKYTLAQFKGTFSTNTSPAPAAVSEQPYKRTEGEFLCPEEGKLDMTFNLYTDNLPTETPLTIS